MRMVTSSFPFCPKSGMYFATGSFSLICPDCSSRITAVVVAITLVSEATSKIVSAVIGSALCPTSSTAPGALPLLTASFRMSSRGANQLCSSFDATGAAVAGAAGGGASVEGFAGGCGLDEVFCANTGALAARRQIKTSTAAGRRRHRLKSTVPFMEYPLRRRASYYKLQKPITAEEGRMPPFSQDALQLAPAFEQQEKQFANAFAIIRQAIEQRAFPGASLAVTHRGALVGSQGFGRFTYKQGSPAVSAETVFDLASLTKVVAATTIAMLLYQRAKLSLDQPVEKTLPEFITLTPKHQHLQRHFVTMRMLLAHSSGLPAYEKLFQIAKAPGDVVRAALTSPLVAPPGTRVEYSDIGFILLGEALTRIAGVPLDEFAQREIFAPL